MRAPLNRQCPICNSVLRITLEDVERERTVRCPNGHDVHLVDQNDGAQKLDRELKKLERTMRRSGIKVKYRRR